MPAHAALSRLVVWCVQTINATAPTLTEVLDTLPSSSSLISLFGQGFDAQPSPNSGVNIAVDFFTSKDAIEANTSIAGRVTKATREELTVEFDSLDTNFVGLLYALLCRARRVPASAHACTRVRTRRADQTDRLRRVLALDLWPWWRVCAQGTCPFAWQL